MFILNRVPTKSLEGTTPFEAWHGRKPGVSFLRTFGCVGHVKKTKPNLAKLEDRSTPMMFLGYERGSKAYRLYDPASSKVVVSRDVVFDEVACWGWESGDGEAMPGGLRALSPSSTWCTLVRGSWLMTKGKQHPRASRRGHPQVRHRCTLERVAGGTLESYTGGTLE